jgi:hypothetical protein
MPLVQQDMGLNSRRLLCLGGSAALGILGTMGAVVYLRYSTTPKIEPPRFVIRPAQEPQWSAAWRNDRRSRPVLAKSAPPEDQIEVYKAFLHSYGTGSSGHLNVGNRTMPLDLPEGDIRGCLAGLEPEPSSSISATHRLSSEMFRTENVRLVDAEQQRLLVSSADPGRTIREGESVDKAVESAFSVGLLELSEVVFSLRREFAVMEFSFSCGALCGHGGTLVFERSGQEWKRSDRSCHSYMN